MPYLINDNCTACGKCTEECPTECISKGKIFVINNSFCIECGMCEVICPANAVLHLGEKGKELKDFE